MINAAAIYPLLGELLHLCQRIEWTMKYMVEQACTEFEFKSMDELKHPKPLEFHWLDSHPLKRSLCERKVRTFAFSIHSVPQKAKTV